MLSPPENNQSENQSTRPVSRQDSVSLLKRISRGIKRYWFVAVPAVMLNVGITLDHVIAKNNEAIVRVRVKEAAWEAFEASKLQDDSPLSDTLRAHWITTNKDGNLDGRISAIVPNPTSTVPIEKLDVALLKNGKRIRDTATDYDGKFVLKNVEPGNYTLIAAGQNGFLAYGVNVLPKLEEFDALNKNTNVDRQKLRQAFYVSHFNLPQDSVVVESLQIDAAAVPPEFNTLERICNNYLPEAAEIVTRTDKDDAKAIGKATNIRGGFKHPLTADGSLEGRIQPISTGEGEEAKLSDMNIFLIRDDVELARVTVEENGKFKIENVMAGVYSLVAAGKDGFAALSLELVDASSGGSQTSANGKIKAQYVSVRGAEPKVRAQLGMAIVTDPDDLQVIKQEVKRIADERRRMLALPNGGNQFANQGLFPPAGFGQNPVVGTGGFPGNVAPGPFNAGPVVGGPNAIGTGRRGLGIAAIAIGITAMASNDSKDAVVDPPVASPVSPNY